jgi:UDPglucose 6-dehydrogenase
VCITDPQALEGARHVFGTSSERVTFESDPYKAAEGTHAVALLTDWAEYRTLDYRRIYDAMERPAFLFDGRNLLDAEELHALGFNVYAIGRPDRTNL